MYSKRYLEAQLYVALGGRVAEEIVYGEDEVTTGASNDLQQVRNIARRMVAQWGAERRDGQRAGGVGVARGQRHVPAQGGVGDTEKEIDDQVQILVQRAYDTCYKLLSENKALMDELTERLVEEETVDYEQLQAMRDAHFEKMGAAVA